MEDLKKGDYVQVLDREDGMYWEAVVRDINTVQRLITVWIPLCKLKMTYHARDVRGQVEERPLQRYSTFKRSDLRLLVRKRRIVYLDGKRKVTDEVQVNDPFLASIELKSGKCLAYERITEIKSMSEDEDEDESDVRIEAERSKRKIVNSKPELRNLRKSGISSDRTKLRAASLASKRLKSAGLSLVRRARNYKSEKLLSRRVGLNRSGVTDRKYMPEKSTKPKNGNSNMNSVSVEADTSCIVISETGSGTRNASSMTEPNSLVSDFVINPQTENSHQDVATTQQTVRVSDFQLPLFSSVSNEIPSALPSTNVPNMANLDFGTSSISIYNPSNMSNVYPSTSTFQSSPSKGPTSFLPGLGCQSSLRGNSNYLPYLAPQDSYQPLYNNNNNNNFGTVETNSQLARLNDLVEKTFYEAKEQSVLLRRILESHEVMVSHLATIVHGIAEATVETNFQNGANSETPQGSYSVAVESDVYSLATSIDECNVMDLTVHRNRT